MVGGDSPEQKPTLCDDGGPSWRRVGLTDALTGARWRAAFRYEGACPPVVGATTRHVDRAGDVL